MRCLGQSCMRNLVNFFNSAASHSTSLVEVTPPSSNTLSGRCAAPFVAVRITSDTARVSLSHVSDKGVEVAFYVFEVLVEVQVPEVEHVAVAQSDVAVGLYLLLRAGV